MGMHFKKRDGARHLHARSLHLSTTCKQGGLYQKVAQE